MAYNPTAHYDELLFPTPTLSRAQSVSDDHHDSSARLRQTYARVPSMHGEEQRYDGIEEEAEISDTPATQHTADSSGLGISLPHRTSTGPSIRSNHTRNYSYETNDRDHSRRVSGQDGWHDGPYGAAELPSETSFYGHSQQTPDNTDTQPLRKRPIYGDDSPRAGTPPPSYDQVHHARSTWTFIVILVLSIYSTLFSLAYLIIAAASPRYGRAIGTNGKLSSSNANLLTAFFAKTIEISFATVFVAFLGQILSRRAFVKLRGPGVTLAEIDMRSWVMQPGLMLTHLPAIRSSAVSVLGALTIVAALCCLLMTTASEALVQPQLRFGDWQHKTMTGFVVTSFANAQWIEQRCQSPTNVDDAEYGNVTCAAVEFASAGFNDFYHYLANWTEVVQRGNVSTDLTHRPQPYALMTDNTTVTGQWIDTTNAAVEINNRIVNNVTAAFPHANVPGASRNGVNGILQPEDLDGLGVYSLHASTTSPAVNVICANMNKDELKPLVYDLWDGTNLDISTWGSPSSPQAGSIGPELMNNKTVVDDIFGWGPEYGQYPPVFAKLPIEYNTILNNTGPYTRNSMYLLGTGGPADSDYFVCGLTGFLTPFCSTRYNVSSSGATLEALCNQPGDSMQYIKSVTNATSGNATISHDWIQGIQFMGTSVSLDTGITDGNASITRLITQLMLNNGSGVVELNPKLPSPAEALAVLAGSTLLMGTQDAPFTEYFNWTGYPSNILPEPQPVLFNASVRAQEYASGGVKGYQHAFYLILATICLLNIVCLAYIIIHRRMVIDFSEPINLFSLAVNSPPSEAMAGTGASGPHGGQYKVLWQVNSAGDDLYIAGRTPEMKSSRESGRMSGGDYVMNRLRPVSRAVTTRFSPRISGSTV